MSPAVLWLLAGQVSLQWNAPPACPTQSEVLERVGVLVGTTIDPEHDVRLAVTATVTASPSGFEARMEVASSSSASPRALSAPACAAVAEAVAVITALALDLTPPPPPPPPPPPRIARPPPPTPVRPRSFARRSLARPAPVGWMLGATAGGELGSRPSGGAAIEAHVGVMWWRLSLEAGVAIRPVQRAVEDPIAGVDSGVDTFTLRFCHATPWVAGEAFGCIGAEIGTLRVRPVGTTVDVSRDQPWRAATLGVGQRVRIYGPVFGVARFDFVIPSTRPDIRINQELRAHVPSAVGVSGGLGVDVLFL